MKKVSLLLLTACSEKSGDERQKDGGRKKVKKTSLSSWIKPYLKVVFPWTSQLHEIMTILLIFLSSTKLSLEKTLDQE